MSASNFENPQLESKNVNPFLRSLQRRSPWESDESPPLPRVAEAVVALAPPPAELQPVPPLEEPGPDLQADLHQEPDDPVHPLQGVIQESIPPVSQCRSRNHLAQQAFLEKIDARIDALLEASRSLERHRADIEWMRNGLQQAMHATDGCLAESTAREHQRSGLGVAQQAAGPKGASDGAGQEPSIRDLPSERESDLLRQIDQLHQQVQLLESQLESSRCDDPRGEEHSLASQEEIARIREQLDQNRAESAEDGVVIRNLRGEVEKLQAELTAARAQANDYKLQISELSAKIVRMKGPEMRDRLQAMSWEERKKTLLKQLEDEFMYASEERRAELLVVETAIQESSAEMRKKDAEIKRLMNLVEQQAISRQGLAIGAVAVGEIIDLDPLVVAERIKLKELQDQWEEKQHQFEIDMSREKAKLSRELLGSDEDSPDASKDESFEGVEILTNRNLAQTSWRRI